MVHLEDKQGGPRGMLLPEEHSPLRSRVVVPHLQLCHEVVCDRLVRVQLACDLSEVRIDLALELVSWD